MFPGRSRDRGCSAAGSYPGKAENWKEDGNPMTYGALLKTIQDQLEKAGCDSPAFDAVCLIEDLGGVPRGQAPLWKGREAPQEAVQRVVRAAEERAQGRPLQYILGRWEFLSLTLRVGEGVLIPRPDTEALCLAAAEELRRRLPPDRPAAVWDLCAGTGCVGLGLCSLLPEIPLRVTAVEWSDQALPYLRSNAAAYPQYRMEPVKADVLRDAARFPGPVEVILSNPPYIPAQDLPALQREVRREPRMALDGGGDGLTFYRVLARDWAPKLSADGFLAVEVGIGQADAVAELLAAQGLKPRILPDWAGVDRVVLAGR